MCSRITVVSCVYLLVYMLISEVTCLDIKKKKNFMVCDSNYTQLIQNVFVSLTVLLRTGNRYFFNFGSFGVRMDESTYFFYELFTPLYFILIKIGATAEG